MLSPLKPLLCRHEYYWSERHRAERCRRCGRVNPAAPAPPLAMTLPEPLAPDPRVDPFAGVETFRLPAPPAAAPLVNPFPPSDPPGAEAAGSTDIGRGSAGDERVPEMPLAGDPGTLKAESLARRSSLLAVLDRLIAGEAPSRNDALDAVLAVIDDAHSADPVLFGEQAAAHFARLRAARAEGAMVPATGIEPVTFGLQNRCSTS